MNTPAQPVIEFRGLSKHCWLERRRGVSLSVLPGPAATEDDERLQVLAGSLRAAALCAVQMDVPLAEALRILERQYRELQTNEE